MEYSKELLSVLWMDLHWVDLTESWMGLDSVETMVGRMVSSLAGEKEYSKAVLMADYWASLMAVSSVDYLVVLAD